MAGSSLLGDQIVASVVVLVVLFVVSFIIGKVIHATMGLRVTPDQEEQGLDITQHAETAYVS